ncbi:MAG: phosphoglucomutase/phosphomannomutase family protein [Limnochordia bacterium]
MVGAAKIRFGTDGWRAIMCDTFTFSNVRLVCQAIAEHLKQAGIHRQGVVVAHDARFLAEHFAQEAAAVMKANGIQVWLPDEDVPTPVAAHAVTQLNAAGAIMFTASHNPPEYNGVKFIPAYAGPASIEITSDIERHLARAISGEPALSQRSSAEDLDVDSFDPRPDYLTSLRRLVDLEAIAEAGLKVGYDAMHGSGRNYVGEILREAGVEVVSLRVERDPLFGGVTPEPQERYLSELVELTKTGRVDLGLATDGDADRFGVIDSDGTYLSPNEVISLLIPYLVERRALKGSVVRTIATTHLIDRLADHFGLARRETPVGFKHICEWMRKEPVVIGGEESGGLSIQGHIPEKDGVLATLLLAEVRAVTGMPLRKYLERWADQVGPSVSKRIDLRYPEEKKTELLTQLGEHPPQTVGDRRLADAVVIDGAKYVFTDGSWMLVRASGTEPLLRIYLEAPDRAALADLETDARQLVLNAV